MVREGSRGEGIRNIVDQGRFLRNAVNLAGCAAAGVTGRGLGGWLLNCRKHTVLPLRGGGLVFVGHDFHIDDLAGAGFAQAGQLRHLHTGRTAVESPIVSSQWVKSGQPAQVTGRSGRAYQSINPWYMKWLITPQLAAPRRASWRPNMVISRAAA